MITSEALKKFDEQSRTKRIDFETGRFEANGKIYFIETRLSIGRYVEFEVLQTEMAYGTSLKEMYDWLITNRQLLNQMRFVDCAINNDKMIAKCQNLKDKEPFILKICTLFCNTEGEDVSKWNNDIIVKKLADWKAENIDTADFFELAVALSPYYIEIYNRLTQSITDQMGEVEAIATALTKR